MHNGPNNQTDADAGRHVNNENGLFIPHGRTVAIPASARLRGWVRSLSGSPFCEDLATERGFQVGWGVSEAQAAFVTSLAIGKPSPRTESLVAAAVQWTLLPLLGTLPQVSIQSNCHDDKTPARGG